MEHIENVYVVNLKKCTKRMQALKKNLDDFGIKFTRWEAVHGKSLPYEEIKQNTSYMCRHFICNTGTIGCHLSHLHIWKHISSHYGNDPNKWFIVLEDDSSVMKGFKENLSNIFQDMQQWPSKYRYPEFIHLSTNRIFRQSAVTSSIYESHVINTTRAYMLSAAGASKLVENIRKVNYHVDVYMTYRQIVYNDLAYYISNVFIGNNDSMQSTISSNTFPRLLPDMFNTFISASNNNDLHIFYNSQLFTIMNHVGINITILLFVLVLAFLLKKGWWIASSVYILVEIIYYYISMTMSSKTSTC